MSTIAERLHEERRISAAGFKFTLHPGDEIKLNVSKNAGWPQKAIFEVDGHVEEKEYDGPFEQESGLYFEWKNRSSNDQYLHVRIQHNREGNQGWADSQMWLLNNHTIGSWDGGGEANGDDCMVSW